MNPYFKLNGFFMFKKTTSNGHRKISTYLAKD